MSASDRDPGPLDMVDRAFRAERPNPWWVADFTCASTWSGFVSRRMHHRRVLAQALGDRRFPGGPVHHSGCGSQYLSIRYSERRAVAGNESSGGRVGDACDNAPAETIDGHYILQSRDHQEAGTVAESRIGGVRHTRAGSLVQYQPIARTDRQRTSCGV